MRERPKQIVLLDVRLCQGRAGRGDDPVERIGHLLLKGTAERKIAGVALILRHAGVALNEKLAVVEQPAHLDHGLARQRALHGQVRLLRIGRAGVVVRQVRLTDACTEIVARPRGRPERKLEACREWTVKSRVDGPFTVEGERGAGAGVEAFRPRAARGARRLHRGGGVHDTEARADRPVRRRAPDGTDARPEIKLLRVRLLAPELPRRRAHEMR